MPAKAKLTKVSDISVNVREIDFVTRFTRNWEALRQVLGILRPIAKQPGTTLTSYEATMKDSALQGGSSVGEGEEIPYTEFQVTPVTYADLTLEKYAKAVSLEAVNKYGAEVAIQRTDDAFLYELQSMVMNRFYTFLGTGTLTGAAATFQAGVAKAIGEVKNKFQTMHRNASQTVIWVNTLDAYNYLGAAELTVQNQFGITYVENFMGADVMILSAEVPENTIYATPVDNIVLYYVDPSNSDFKQLGLDYTVEGETNLLGFHANGDYSHAVGESFAIMGMALWAEYLDAIAVIEIDDSFLTDLTVTADASDASYPWTALHPADFQSDVSVADGKITGKLTFIEGGLAPSGPLSGDGYFLALKFDNFATGLTYANVKVGLNPTQGTGLVTLDSDKNAVFKITDKNVQKLKTVQTDAQGHKNIQYFDLSGLELVDTGA